MKLTTRLPILLVAAGIGGTAIAQQPPPRPAARGPDLVVALKLAQAAIDACGKAGFKVGVSIVDTAGEAKVTLLADGSGMHSATTVRKAATAMTFKMTGSALETKMKTDPALAAQIAANKDFNAHPGSLPLIVGGQVIGGIGLSGAPTHEEDEACGKAAIDQFGPLLK